MPRGPKKHMKRINAPKHWMLDKLGGIYAPKPSAGPHKQRECLPLNLLLRNRLKYALNNKESQTILMQRLIKIDGKVRTDNNYPTGFMDTISIEKTNQNFRLLFDVKGRFMLHRIKADESNIKLCKIRDVMIGKKGVPCLQTNDGRTIRYADPLIKANDTIKLNLTSGKVEEFYKFEIGNVAMVTGGHNVGRVGIVQARERHHGGYDIVHVKDKTGATFATRINNVFIIGKGATPAISLPKAKGIKLTIIEEYTRRHK
eukprot:CAMPEP_0114542050 /NCGR_PEP_ID=MMETSP0114-20121206/1634_1 /TAXON_ID=31324 /ORGANISM="Goniomonas sp, Strain m" /LENGTH=257 /DNA_ID=CAMNT_0001726333 /DNA_START=49 /DNA_END=822 /DNA_ORIENTATION=-